MQNLSEIKKVHFIGIGGISLSALAKLMLLWGKNVSGSDISYSPFITELIEKGVDVWIGSNPLLIGAPDLVVYSSAIGQNDKELIYCKEHNIQVMERHLFLALVAKEFNCAIAIGGTHGKTTACGLLGNIFKQAEKSFCAHIGGDVISLSNLYYTGNDYFVTEACEYKKSLLSLPAKISLVLNAEADHPDTYSNIEELYQTFDKFLFDGLDHLAFVCSDTKYYKEHLNHNKKYIVTFGTSIDSDFIISDIEEYKCGYYSFSLSYMRNHIFDIKMSLPGIHNIYNAVAAISISHILHIDKHIIKNAIENFKGIKRRFEKKGMLNGATIYHDYAHHPSEIKAVIDIAKKLTKGRLIVVFQPHTFSRTSALFEDFTTAFDNCDEIYLAKEYSARETKSQGKSAYELFKKLNNKNSYYYDEIISLAKHLINKLSSFDMLLVLGAGDIEKLCELMV